MSANSAILLQVNQKYIFTNTHIFIYCYILNTFLFIFTFKNKIYTFCLCTCFHHKLCGFLCIAGLEMEHHWAISAKKKIPTNSKMLFQHTPLSSNSVIHLDFKVGRFRILGEGLYVLYVTVTLKPDILPKIPIKCWGSHPQNVALRKTSTPKYHLKISNSVGGTPKSQWKSIFIRQWYRGSAPSAAKGPAVWPPHRKVKILCQTVVSLWNG